MLALNKINVMDPASLPFYFITFLICKKGQCFRRPLPRSNLSIVSDHFSMTLPHTASYTTRFTTSPVTRENTMTKAM